MTHEVVKIITIVLICVTETAMLHHAFATFLNRNLVKKKYSVLALIGYFCCVIFTSVNDFSVYFVSSFCFFLIVIIAFLFFNDIAEIKITVSFMFVALNYACTILASTMHWRIQQQSVWDYPVTLKQTILTQIFLYTIFSLLVYIIDKLRGLQEKHRAVFNGIYVFTVPLCMLLLIFKLFTFTSTVQSSSYFFVYHLAISGLLFLTSLSLYFLTDRTSTLDNVNRQKMMVEQMLAMQNNYYSALDSQQKEIQSIFHDLKNHMRYIKTMLDSQQYDEASQYINRVYNDTVQLQSSCQSGNRVFDSILNQKLSVASRNEIPVKLSLIIPPILTIDDVDICILLGNLMDNAIEACNRIEEDGPKKFIDVKASIKKEYLYVNISNAYNGQVKIENHVYQTVKTGVRYSGIGLSNVQRVVEKYNGKVSITHEDNVFTVSCLLGLDLPQNK